MATAPKSSMNVHLLSAWGYDEPEIFFYSNRQFGLIDADAGNNMTLRPSLSTCPQFRRSSSRCAGPGLRPGTHLGFGAVALSLVATVPSRSDGEKRPAGEVMGQGRSSPRRSGYSDCRRRRRRCSTPAPRFRSGRGSSRRRCHGTCLLWRAGRRH